MSTFIFNPCYQTPNFFFMSNLFTTLTRKLFPAEREVYNSRQMEFDKILPRYPDPSTLNTIIEIVLQSDKFIVTIDDALSINWMTNNKYTEYARDFSSVTSKVQLLSMQVNSLFTGRANKYKYKRIIAEALALVLDEKKSANALALLKEVEYRITEQGKERTRMAYIYYAFFTTLLIGVLLGITVQYKNMNWLFGGDVSRYQISIATFLGGIGAFLSAFIRFRNYEGSTNSGLSMHRLDGFLRVLYGCIAGLIFTLAIYSNTILGFLNTAAANQPWVIYFFATMAGASEFLVPGLIKATTPQTLFKKTGEPEIRERTNEKSVLMYKNKTNGEESRNVNSEKQAEEINGYGYEEATDKNSGYFVQGKINLQD